MSVEATSRVNATPIHPRSAHHVLTILADHAHENGREAYPGVDSIRKRTGLSRRSVQLILQGLRAAGLIAVQAPAHWVVNQDGSRYQRPTTYAVALGRLNPPYRRDKWNPTVLEPIRIAIKRWPSASEPRNGVQLVAPLSEQSGVQPGAQVGCNGERERGATGSTRGVQPGCTLSVLEPPDEPSENPPAREARAPGGSSPSSSGSAREEDSRGGDAVARWFFDEAFKGPVSSALRRRVPALLSARRADGAADDELILVARYSLAMAEADGGRFRALTRPAWFWGEDFAQHLRAARAWETNPSGRKEYHVGGHEDQADPDVQAWNREYQENVKRMGLD